jgi:K+-transporting ATPase ATPase A chain
MTTSGWIQISFFFLVLLLVTKPLGIYIERAIDGKVPWLVTFLKPLERFMYFSFGIDPKRDMRWTEYTFALLAFSLVSMLFSYVILRCQGLLPLNPMGFSTATAPAYATLMTPDLAFNTAVSFTTNTNWQAYSGENTLSYLSQMLALAFHNWTSAAVGIAVAVAFTRGFSRRNARGIGNFWVDLTRITLYLLLPLCFITSFLLISQGVIQNFNPYQEITTVEGIKQIIPQGPIASQEAIKMLGTNGGGFLNANSAHPFENPTPLSNLIEMLSIFLIPAGLTYYFGRAVKDTRQGWALFITMLLLSLTGVSICYFFEAQGNPNFVACGVQTSPLKLVDHGGNMEGKEMRFGLANSALFATVTTDASCGAVNSMHDSFTPLGGLIPLLNIQLGEIVFGGVGSGLYGMLVFAVLTVFIAGLMVGRTPEYVGKKIEKKDVKMAMLFVLAAALSILVFTAASSVLDLPNKCLFNPPGATYNNINNSGPHGLSEMLYTFSSCTGNNGSAFAGINCNTMYYNIACALAMIVGRFFMIVPILAMAGSLVEKKYVPPSSGTFPTYGALFVILLISVILIVGALTFLPALTLGPIVEHFLMNGGRLF